jgi:hypothetical protein
MRLKFVVCKVLQREAYFCAARSHNVVDIVLVAQGLHNEPDKLREQVQRELEIVEDVQGRPYDACLLGYGLCSNGIDRIRAKIPVIVPRAHDCVTLLLGSMQKYKDYFDSHRGIYWYSPGWIECSIQPGKERYEKVLREYEEKYGAENAQYLMEMEQNWMKEYSWATYVDWGLADSARYKQYTKECAEYLKWNYDELAGDSSLMQQLVDGQWDESKFLRVEPGQKITADLTDPGLIRAE